MSRISLKRRFIWRFLFHFNTSHPFLSIISFYSALSIYVDGYVFVYSVVDQSSRRKFQRKQWSTIYTTIGQNERQQASKKRTKKFVKRGKKFDDRPLHNKHFKEVKQSNLLSFCMWFCILIRMCLCMCVRVVVLFGCVWQLPLSVLMCVCVCARTILFFILSLSVISFCIHTITNTLIFHRRSEWKGIKTQWFLL